MRINGITRFIQTPYHSLITDKRMNGLKINKSFAVHSYTFGDLHENIKDSVYSTANFSRYDNITLNINTEDIPIGTEAFIHVFTVGYNKLKYKTDYRGLLQAFKVYNPYKPPEE